MTSQLEASINLNASDPVIPGGFDPSDPTDPVLKQIDVRVTWNEPGDPAGTPPRRYGATTRRFN